jgi:hypothetical protein
VNMKLVERFFPMHFPVWYVFYVAFSHNKDIVQSYIRQVFPHMNEMASVNCAVAVTDFACISSRVMWWAWSSCSSAGRSLLHWHHITKSLCCTPCSTSNYPEGGHVGVAVTFLWRYGAAQCSW